jgi:hypothetical protein
MEKTFSSRPIEAIEYYPQRDGSAVVYLRENIAHEVADSPDGGETEFWTADEVVTVTDLSREEVEEAFDALWVKGETESKSLEQRLAEVEELAEELVTLALGEE